MGRTAVNVAGQALVPTIVAKRAGILDTAIFGGGDARATGGSAIRAPVAYSNSATIKGH
jgi:hypothetical protein